MRAFETAFVSLQLGMDGEMSMARSEHHRHWNHGSDHQGSGNDTNGDPSPSNGDTSPPPGPTDPSPPAQAGTANAADFAALGATFNDATRALVGGLWQNTVEEGGQGFGSVFRYVNDLQAVQTGLQTEINAGQFTGDTLANARAILADINTAVSAATASVNGGGTFGTVAAAETALRESHLAIINTVQGDANLAALATQNGANGFQAGAGDVGRRFGGRCAASKPGRDRRNLQ